MDKASTTHKELTSIEVQPHSLEVHVWRTSVAVSKIRRASITKIFEPIKRPFDKWIREFARYSFLNGSCTTTGNCIFSDDLGYVDLGWPRSLGENNGNYLAIARGNIKVYWSPCGPLVYPQAITDDCALHGGSTMCLVQNGLTFSSNASAATLTRENGLVHYKLDLQWKPASGADAVTIRTDVVVSCDVKAEPSLRVENVTNGQVTLRLTTKCQSIAQQIYDVSSPQLIDVSAYGIKMYQGNVSISAANTTCSDYTYDGAYRVTAMCFVTSTSGVVGVQVVSAQTNETIASFDMYMMNNGQIDISGVSNITRALKYITAKSTSSLDIQLPPSNIVCQNTSSIYYNDLTLRGPLNSMTNMTDCAFVIEGGGSVTMYNLNWRSLSLTVPLFTTDNASSVNFIGCQFKQAAPYGIIVPLFSASGSVGIVSLYNSTILRAGKIQIGGNVSQLFISSSSLALIMPQPSDVDGCFFPTNVMSSVNITGSNFDFTGCTISGFSFYNVMANITTSNFSNALYSAMLFSNSRLFYQGNIITKSRGKIRGFVLNIYNCQTTMINNTFSRCQDTPLYMYGGNAALSDNFFLSNSGTLAGVAVMYNMVATVYRDYYYRNLGLGDLSYGIYLYNTNATMVNISGFSNQANSGSVLYILNSAQNTVEVQGLTCRGNIALFYGGCIALLGGTLSVRDSLMENNLATVMGGAFYTYQTINLVRSLVLKNVTFRGNFSPFAGGGMYLNHGGGSVEMNNVTFYNNTGTFSGGAMLVNLQNSTSRYGPPPNVSMTDVQFVNNTATSGAAIANTGVIQEMTLTRCEMSGNKGVEGLAIFSSWRVRNMTLNGVIISGHTDGSAVKVTGETASMSIYNSTFVDNTALGYGGAIYQKGIINNVTITNTSFTTSSASYGGAVQFVSTSGGNITLHGNVFYNNNVTISGGAMHLSGFRSVTIEKNKCKNNTALSSGGCLRLTRSNTTSVVMRDNIFEANSSPKGSAVYSDGDSTITQMTSTDNEMSYNDAASGGTIELMGSVSLTVDSDQVTSNSGMYGAYYLTPASVFTLSAVSITATNNTATSTGSVFTLSGRSTQTNEIADSQMSGNEGGLGGVIYVGTESSQYGSSLYNVSMSNNTAQMGGAVYITSGGQGNSSFFSCSFVHNSADKGGAVYASVKEGLVVMDSTLTDNVANDKGGALFISSASGGSAIIRTVFNRNTAITEGGALFLDQTTSKVRDTTRLRNVVNNSTIQWNRAGKGGGMSVYQDTDVTYTRISQNAAMRGGGIDLNNRTSLRLESSELYDDVIYLSSSATLMSSSSGNVSVQCDSGSSSQVDSASISDITKPLSWGAIAGIVVGSVSSFCVIIVTILLVMRRRENGRKRRMIAEEMQRLNVSDLMLDDVTVEEVIGHGNFGEVYRGSWNETVVALKGIKAVNSIEDAEIRREIVLLKKLNHPNVVNLLGVTTHGSRFLMVLEYLEGGSLDRYLQKNQRDLNDNNLISLCFDIVKGMLYLQSKGIIHRDLAARNILVDGQKHAKISDFGMSREDNHYEAKKNILPFRWTAPETIRYKVSTFQSDVWSFGVLAWEIFSLGRTPYWELSSNKEVLHHVVEEKKTLLQPFRCPDELFSILSRCWEYEPPNRPSFRDIYTQMRELYTVLLPGDTDNFTISSLEKSEAKKQEGNYDVCAYQSGLESERNSNEPLDLYAHMAVYPGETDHEFYKYLFLFDPQR
ncbi:tyrosine-protein kinase Fps85D-like isoform 2 [Planoprotostelium fungivorum]|uniref:Tyrosine-protein kinase Fps85D-like isoform 2 n=1 Tax=Planoprotostelium fungivorum TaxID=1890364 RepID=A0A2P6MT40_9EUKA|nr:tyrosine-protein kinase Fps85D-like isoform 2 [Planoprotostelium fungivorum]